MFSQPLYILGTPLLFASGIQTVPCRQTRKLFQKLEENNKIALETTISIRVHR